MILNIIGAIYELMNTYSLIAKTGFSQLELAKPISVQHLILSMINIITLSKGLCEDKTVMVLTGSPMSLKKKKENQ